MVTFNIYFGVRITNVSDVRGKRKKRTKNLKNKNQTPNTKTCFERNQSTQ